MIEVEKENFNQKLWSFIILFENFWHILLWAISLCLNILICEKSNIQAISYTHVEYFN